MPKPKTKIENVAKYWIEKRRQRRSSTIGAINLAPMMDVMFNLLIFFLVATTFKLPEGLLQARLPRTQGISSKQQSIVPLVPIKIFLDSKDSKVPLIRVNSTIRTDAASLIIIEGFEQLHNLLQQILQKPGISRNTPIIIAAKPQTSWDLVVNAYNTAVRTEFKHVVFAKY